MITPAFHTRFLAPEDIPALLALEQSKWDVRQAACGETLLERIRTCPDLSVGAFCASTGSARASLFMRPVNAATLAIPTSWQAAASMSRPVEADCRSLFGISLSSTHPVAADAIFTFFHRHAVKAGWQDVYLGSPIPGFRQARRKNPALSVFDYVHARGKWHRNEPLDPQLRYYYAKGFRQVISIQENYFPHAESLDYGVILRSVIPTSSPVPR